MRFRDSIEWQVTPEGVTIDGDLQRTGGEPVTMRRILSEYGRIFSEYAHAYGVPVSLLLATAATETNGNPLAVRLEPGYVSDDETPHRVSPGMMQTLISTAREALRDATVGRDFLLRPAGSIQAGAAYIGRQGTVTGFDPVFVAAAYNAGGLYHEDKPANRWRLKCYPLGTGEHIDRFVRWYGDACAVLKES